MVYFFKINEFAREGREKRPQRAFQVSEAHLACPVCVVERSFCPSSRASSSSLGDVDMFKNTHLALGAVKMYTELSEEFSR